MCLIPAIRGISNLDAIHTAEVFGQSVSLLGVILLIPITERELNPCIREIICTKSWSYEKSIIIRLICCLLMITVLTMIFALGMRKNNCSFPFGEFIFATVLYAVFLGLLGLVFSQLGNNSIAGYFVSLGYWSLCQFGILTEESSGYVFPVIGGVVDGGRMLILAGMNILLFVVWWVIVNRQDRRMWYFG